MQKENIQAQWHAYIAAIRQWDENIESRDTKQADADLQFPTEKCLETNKRQIKIYLDDVIDKSIKLPLERTWSSRGRTEFQNLIYIIEQTDRVFFSGDERYFSNIIYDHYNIEHGVQGIYDIISCYIKWVDVDVSNNAV